MYPAALLISANEDLAEMVTNWAEGVGAQASSVDVDSLVTGIQQRIMEAFETAGAE